MLQKIKANASRLKLWDSDIRDRLDSDSISHRELNVHSIMSSKPFTIKRKERCKNYDRMPVHLLPNCASYKGENNELSWLNAIFGLISRSSKQGGEIIGWRNTRRNSFIKYYFNLMGHYRDRGWSYEYWRVGTSLMRNRSYQVACLNFVLKNWHLDLTDKQLTKVISELEVLKLITNVQWNHKIFPHFFTN